MSNVFYSASVSVINAVLFPFRYTGIFGTSDKPVILLKDSVVPFWLELTTPGLNLICLCNVEVFFDPSSGWMHAYPIEKEEKYLFHAKMKEGKHDGVITGAPTHIHAKPRNTPNGKKNLMEIKDKQLSILQLNYATAVNYQIVF